jgi:Ca2+-binding RTX toxin-like protein
MYAGTGGDTLQGGRGNDVFHVDNHHGNDTIDGGSGNDAVNFGSRASTDISSLHTSGGVTVIHFNDGQSVNVSHIENLVFTDKTDHL